MLTVSSINPPFRWSTKGFCSSDSSVTHCIKGIATQNPEVKIAKNELNGCAVVSYIKLIFLKTKSVMKGNVSEFSKSRKTPAQTLNLILIKSFGKT